MIRRSVFVAILAIVLSMLAHMLGLTVTAPSLTNPSAGDNGPDAVELSSAFEDFADVPPEPEPPAPVEPNEPEEEPPVEPEDAEIPTSDALVASPDPQNTYAPDTGSSTLVQPEAPEEVLDPVDETEGAESAGAEVTESPVVEPETIEETPEGTPDGATPQVEAEPAEAPVPEPTEQVAAVPVPATPSDIEPVEPDVPVATTEPTAEDIVQPVPDAETGESEQAVVSSLRPQLPDRRPQPTLRGALNAFKNFDDLQFPEQTIESPLTAYRREGLDAFRQDRSGNRSGGRGPGNSDRTNYAGEVLVHLNRTPPVYVAGRGYARVFFEINPDGTLAWVDVIESSGASDIERAAKQQVRNASPFPRPPGGVSRKLSFFYQLR